MQTRIWFISIAIASACIGGCEAPPAQPVESSVIESDRVRLQRHFDDVIAGLANADVSHLDDAQRAARARHIDELARYRDRGVFPHNHDFDHAHMPYFIDDHGTRCAMAHLIEASGHGELVARVARERNNAFVAELASDPALIAWLDRSGLSAREAAWIQPTYPCESFPENCPEKQTDITPAYGIASAVLGVGNGAAIALNVSSPTKPRALLATVTGIAGALLGVPKLDQDGQVQVLGTVNFGLGAITASLGVYNLFTDDPAPPARASIGGVTFEPVVSANGFGLRGQF